MKKKKKKKTQMKSFWCNFFYDLHFCYVQLTVNKFANILINPHQNFLIRQCKKKIKTKQMAKKKKKNKINK